jgi:hypothetical protein
VAAGTGDLAWYFVDSLLILGSVEGELVGAAGEEYVGFGNDDGPCVITV